MIPKMVKRCETKSPVSPAMKAWTKSAISPDTPNSPWTRRMGAVRCATVIAAQLRIIEAIPTATAMSRLNHREAHMAEPEPLDGGGRGNGTSQPERRHFCCHVRRAPGGIEVGTGSLPV